MKKKAFLSLYFILVTIIAQSQFKFTYDGREYFVQKTSKFKDSTGKEYDYGQASWIMMGGDHEVLPADPKDASKGFLLSRISKEEKLKRILAAPKPTESPSFKTGKKLDDFKAYDINGKLIDTKQLQGKIVVLNFWFIKCPPCKYERPFLNKIVDDYKADSNVVFISIAIDRKDQLEPYLKENEFKYNVIPDGNKLAKSYDIAGYPTQLIIDKEGKIAFHTLSYFYVIDYWMRKTIDELRSK